MARAGRDSYPGAESSFLDLLTRLWPAADVELIVGDSLPGAVCEIGQGYRAVPVTSDAWEFGTWDALISDYAQPSCIGKDDLVVLVTSAYRNGHSSYHELLSGSRVGRLMGRPFVVGHIDYYDELVRGFGYDFQHWLRSSILVMPATALWRLGSVATPLPSQAELFSDDLDAPFLDGCGLSSSYRRYITRWLTGDGTGQGARWANSTPLVEMGLPRFRDKCYAIFREHLLTRRMYAMGLDVWDATFLASIGTDVPLPRAPSWRYQVSHRFRDASVPSRTVGALQQSAIAGPEWPLEAMPYPKASPTPVSQPQVSVDVTPVLKESTDRSRRTRKGREGLRPSTRADLGRPLESAIARERLLQREHELVQALDEARAKIRGERMRLREAIERTATLERHAGSGQLQSRESESQLPDARATAAASQERLRRALERTHAQDSILFGSRLVRLALRVSDWWRRVRGAPSLWQLATAVPGWDSPAESTNRSVSSDSADYVLVLESCLFDSNWYAETYLSESVGLDPLREFMTHGWLLGRNPSRDFDCAFYLRENPDVARAGINPLVHYLRHGRREGRDPAERVRTADVLQNQLPSL